MTSSRVLRVPRETLAAAVAPASLASTLEGLVMVGALEGFELRDAEVLVWGDTVAMECALQRAQAVDDTDARQLRKHSPYDYRSEYYATARAYMHTASYRRLPALQRKIWKLHAEGISFARICFKLHVTPMKVRVAIRTGRRFAQLPLTASTLGHGNGSGGRPPIPPDRKPDCAVVGCAQKAESRGLCNRCYHRARRAGKLSA